MKKRTVSIEVAIGRDAVSVESYINGGKRATPLLVGTSNPNDIAMAYRRAAMEFLVMADGIQNNKHFLPVTDIDKQIKMMLSENAFYLEGESNE